MDQLGKGVYLWKSSNIFGGDLGAFINYIAGLKLDFIMIKIGDANTEGSRSFPDMKTAIELMRHNFPKMKIFGWHYVYCGAWYDSLGVAHFTNICTPEQEAQFAKAKVNQYGLDGYVIDAERELKAGYGSSTRAYQPASRAGRFMGTLKGIGVPVALASYRFPDYHREFPWSTFLNNETMTMHMPQVYWGNYSQASIRELANSVNQLRKLRDIPFVPTGRAYIGDGHPDPKPQEIIDFNHTAKELKLHGVSYWALDFLITHPNGALRSIVIRDFDWGLDQGSPSLPPTPLPPPVVLEKVRVTCRYLYVREGPGKQYKAVGSLKYNEQVPVYKKEYSDYVWGLIDPVYSRWCALNYTAKV